MPDDARGEGGYLLKVLAHGARPFAYRGRVHRLLGVPPVEERRISFVPPLPPVGFQYAARAAADGFAAPPPPVPLPRLGRGAAGDAHPPGFDAPAPAPGTEPAAGAGGGRRSASAAVPQPGEEQNAALAQVRAQMRALAVPPREGPPSASAPRAVRDGGERVGAVDARLPAAAPATPAAPPASTRSTASAPSPGSTGSSESAVPSARIAGAGAPAAPDPPRLGGPDPAGALPPTVRCAAEARGRAAEDATIAIPPAAADAARPPSPGLSIPGVTEQRALFAALSAHVSGEPGLRMRGVPAPPLPASAEAGPPRRAADREGDAARGPDQPGVGGDGAGAAGDARLSPELRPPAPPSARTPAAAARTPSAPRAGEAAPVLERAPAADAAPRPRTSVRSGEREVARLREAVETLAARHAAPPPAPRPEPPPPPVQVRAPETVVFVQAGAGGSRLPRALWSRSTLRGTHTRSLR